MSSPKFFTARSSASAYTRRSVALVVIFVTGLAGIIFGLFAIFRPGFGNTCKYEKPISVSVAWDGATRYSDSSSNNEPPKRHKATAFVGIQTGFGSVGRRRALRQTWFPSDHQGLERLEESTGLVFRFIIGKTNDKSKMADLRREIAEYDDFMLLDIEEEYSKLPYKTLAFFKAAYALYDAEFYVKADDDIYLRPGILHFMMQNSMLKRMMTYI